MALNEQRRTQLDGIVLEMVSNGENDQNIQLVVDDFKSKYDTPESVQGPTGIRNPFSFLGGEKIGEYLGTKAAGGTFGKTVQKTITGLPEETLARPDVQKTLKESTTPSGKALAGDVATAASTFFPYAKTAKLLSKAAKPLTGMLGGLLRKTAPIAAGGTGAYVQETARDIADEKEDPFTPGGGTAIGMAIPGAYMGASKVPAVTRSLSSIFTGVPKETLQRAADPVYAKRMETAIKEVTENEKQPFFTLANRIRERIVSAEKAATDAIKQAVEDFVKANPMSEKTFDVRPEMQELRKALWAFRDSGLIVSKKKVGINNKTGEALYEFSVKNSPQGAFTPREIDALNRLFTKINSAKKIGVRDVLALRKSFATAYDEIPLGNNQRPTPYHAAVMAMKTKAEDIIDKVLPTELKLANKGYRRVMEMREDFADRIVDSQGRLKDGAEQYIANLGNMNKEQIRKEVSKYATDLGLDISDEVQVIKDAQRLSELFPRTASRTADVIRSLAVSGIGFSTVGAPGAITGLIATSPRVAGKAATAIGKAKDKYGPGVARAKEMAKQFTGMNSGVLTPGDALVEYLKKKK